MFGWGESILWYNGEVYFLRDVVGAKHQLPEVHFAVPSLGYDAVVGQC